MKYIWKNTENDFKNKKSENEKKRSIRFCKKTKAYFSLAPQYQENLETYTSVLNMAINDDSIANIGITGGYGSGKSTVIETYKTKYRRKKFIHIALANYELNGNEGKDAIEVGIISQLASQVKSQHIPKTGLKIKENVSKVKVLMYTFGFGKLLNYLFVEKLNLILLDLNDWQKINYYSDWIYNISDFFWFLAIVYIIYDITKIILYGKKIKSISLLGNKVDVEEKEKIDGESKLQNSYFDIYLNDIIYILRNCKADAIVFEDVDRFKDVEIFQRLRNINNMVNIKQKKYWILIINRRNLYF